MCEAHADESGFVILAMCLRAIVSTFMTDGFPFGQVQPALRTLHHPGCPGGLPRHGSVGRFYQTPHHQDGNGNDDQDKEYSAGHL